MKRAMKVLGALVLGCGVAMGIAWLNLIPPEVAFILDLLIGVCVGTYASMEYL